MDEYHERGILKGRLTWNDTFVEDRLGVETAAFIEQRDYDYGVLSGNTSSGLSINDYFNLNSSSGSVVATNSITKYKTRSVFGNATVSFDDTYFLDLSLRNDWDSRLPSSKNSYLYGGVSASVMLSQFINAEWLNFWKLHASIAQVGSTLDACQTTYTYNAQRKYNTTATLRQSLTQLKQQIKPTISTSYEVGTEFRMFKNRLRGDISKWKKFNATLRMLMAIKLADVAPTVGKERFAKAYADGGMVDVGDGLNYTFSTNTNVEDGSTHTYYAWFYYVGNAGYAQRGLGFSPNKFIVDGLKEYKDPRMFTYFTTNGYLGQVVDADGNAVDPESFDSYNGVTYGLISNDAVRAEAENACSVADKYCEINAAYGLITTARCLLVEAEAAQLGWISESASTLYEAGIRASFDYNGATGVDDYIAAHPLPSDKTNALKEIVMQRWFDGFLTDEIEIWSDWRRYNVPSLPLTEYQKESCKAETYPYSLIYYDDDRNYNIDNYNECINTYFSGNDSRWQRIWWDVADNE